MSSANTDDLSPLEAIVPNSLPSAMTLQIEFITEMLNFNSAPSVPPFGYSEQQATSAMHSIEASFFDADPSQPWPGRAWATAPYVSEISPEHVGIVASQFVQISDCSFLTY